MEQMITILITLAISFLPMAAHLYVDYHRMKAKKPIMHKRGATMVAVLAVALGVLNARLLGFKDEKVVVIEAGLFVLLAFCNHLALFDILWNKIEHHKWNYLGTVSNPNRALTDIVWSEMPEWLQAVLRILVLAAGWFVYLKFK